MTGAFGIDHPLLATRDIAALRARLISMGFNMTAIGKHPWGTSTSLAMFNGCLIEIMGIYDDGLLDQVPAGEFRFGRHVHQHLQQREGVALTALHSTDSVADAAHAAAAGFTVAGHLEFGRDVTLPDGTTGRTRTTLALLPDPDWPRLSFFLCQQHRPDLIYVPEWLVHPNSVHRICGVTIRAETAEQGRLRAKLSGLYPDATQIDGGFFVQTANGPMRVQTRAAIEATFGPLPANVAADPGPGIVAMDLAYHDPAAFSGCIKRADIELVEHASGLITRDASKTANTFFRFIRMEPT